MSDRLNPIFVYEIRQVVRNRALLFLLCLYLILLVSVCGFVLFQAMFDGALYTSDDRLGRNLLRAILATLLHTSLLATVLFSASTTIFQGLEEDVFPATPLTWRQMAVGKLQVATLLLFQFYCLTMPFVAVTWMFRGVDIFPVLLVLVAAFFIELTIAWFTAASLHRCRTTKDLWGTLGLLLLAAPALLLLWAFTLGCLYAVLESPASLLGKVSVAVLASVAVVMCLAVFVIGGIFAVRHNPHEYSNEARYFLTGFGAWILAGHAVMVVVMIGALVMGVI